ncbi:MAG: hypothetical protein NXH99_01455 [Rhodobacteraceae bacterium]|nr:hypothetical protein [Paracoccaceae bacterium]
MKKSELGTDEGKQIIEIWSKVVDTQMHFNEMQVKSRQLGLTFVAAALGVGVVLLSRGNDFSYTLHIGTSSLDLHVSVFLVLGAWLALAAVRQLDLKVYHRMLRGAVMFGEDFENNCLIPMFGLNKGMTQSISHFSRYDDADAKAGPDGRYRYSGKHRKTAHDKIRKFYRYAQGFLLGAAVVLLIVTNLSSFSNIKSDAIANERAISGENTSSEDHIR